MFRFNLPFLKTTIYVSLTFTVKFHFLQYFSKLLIKFCRPSAVSENKTESSANNSKNKNKSSISYPWVEFCCKYDSISLTKSENMIGDNISPCNKPTLHSNISEKQCECLTHNFISSYIDRITLNSLPNP